MTHYFGLLGKKLSHSYSPRFFAQKFLGLPFSCDYKLFESENIQLGVALLKSVPNLVGFNVTIPYKQDIIPYLNSISDAALVAKAVNTVVVLMDGSWHGHNTDIDGVKTSLDSLCGNNIPPALLLGTGGAAAGVCYTLINIYNQNRVLQVSRLGVEPAIAYDAIDAAVLNNYKLIINATPVGMYPNVAECPALPYALLTNDHILWDLIYNPEETLFLRKGKQQGCKTMNGLLMLQTQAEAAWKIWLPELQKRQSL